jgi:hypothetical protein
LESNAQIDGDEDGSEEDAFDTFDQHISIKDDAEVHTDRGDTVAIQDE